MTSLYDIPRHCQGEGAARFAPPVAPDDPRLLQAIAVELDKT